MRFFFPNFRPEVDRELPEKDVKKLQKTLPEAFPEYPEVANKPARQRLGGFFTEPFGKSIESSGWFIWPF